MASISSDSMPAPPNEPPLHTSTILQILFNIVVGVHPRNPVGPGSVLEYFTHTRYTDVIRPQAMKEWEQNQTGNNIIDGLVEDPEPSLAICDDVSKQLFEALSPQELAQITQEYNAEWASIKKNYRQTMETVYGRPNKEHIIDDVPHVLGTILTALETLTGNHLILWAGGRGKRGFNLINVTSDGSNMEEPAYIPESQKGIFEQLMRETMSAKQETFIEKCVSVPAVLPPYLFHKPSFKKELIDQVMSATNVPDQPPIFPNAPSPGVGHDSGQNLLMVENGAPSLSFLAGDRCIKTPQVPASDKEGMGRKRARTSEMSSLIPITLTKKPRPIPLPSPRRSFRNVTGSNPPLIGQALHPSTTSLPPCSTTIQSSGRNLQVGALLPSFPSQTLTKNIKVKDKPLRIPAACPAPIQNLIKTIPTLARWLSNSLCTIVEVDLGPMYFRLIILLVELESLYGYITGRCRLSPIGRPNVLTKWINSGRRHHRFAVANVGAYADTWGKWWQSLQPKWRHQDEKGRSTHPADMESLHSWKPLVVPGANGLLGVVASFYWWGCNVRHITDVERKKREDDRWIKAVEDCTWVLEHLVKAVKIAKTTGSNMLEVPSIETEADDIDQSENESSDKGDDEDELLESE